MVGAVVGAEEAMAALKLHPCVVEGLDAADGMHVELLAAFKSFGSVDF
jgi:hypothetical protein